MRSWRTKNMPYKIADSDLNAPTPLGKKARALKDKGLSWKEVGRKLGVSRQTAQQAAYPKARREAQRRYEGKFASRPTE